MKVVRVGWCRITGRTALSGRQQRAAGFNVGMMLQVLLESLADADQCRKSGRSYWGAMAQETEGAAVRVGPSGSGKAGVAYGAI